MKKCFCLLISLYFFFGGTINAQNIIINQEQASLKEQAVVELEEASNWEETITTYQALIHFYQKEKKANQWLNHHINLVKAYRMISDYSSAKSLLENCLQSDFFISIHDDLLKAEAFHQHGITLYLMDLYPTAKDYFQQALIIRKLQQVKDTTLLIKGYQNMGSCNNFLGNYDKAISFLDTALQLNMAFRQDTLRLANTYEVMAQAFTEKKDFDQAENYLFTALSYFQKIYKDEPWLLADYYENITFFYAEFNLPKKVIEYSEKRLSIYSAISEKEDSDYYGIASTYNNLGIGYQKLFNYEEALKVFHKALKINQSFFDDRAYDAAINWNNIGLTQKLQGNFSDALIAYNKALQIPSSDLTRQDTSDFYYNIGKAHYELGDFQKALATFQKAITLIIPEYDIKDSYSNPSIEAQLITDKLSLAENLWEKAKTFTALATLENPYKNLLASHSNYTLVEQLLEQIRKDLESDKSKEFIVEQASKIYEDALINMWELYQLTPVDSLKEKMLHLAEKSKAIILLDAFKDLEAKKAAGVAPEFLQKEQLLKASIGKLELDIATREKAIEIEGDPTLLGLRQKHLDAKANLEKVVQQMELQNPTYFQLKNSQTPYPISAIQEQLLEPNQSIIEYFITKKYLFIFQLSSENLETYRIPLDFPLANWISQFRESIYSNFEQGKTNKSESDVHQLYLKFASKLYDKLLSPLGKLSEQIIFIPDGVLGFLPFDALLKEAVITSDFHQLPYLGYEHQLSYGFSINSLMEVNKSINRGNGQWLGFAPSFASNAQLLARNSRTGLNPLLHNQEEVKQISLLMETNQLNSFFGQAATKEQFLQHSPDFTHIHLSSHAMMNANDPDQSFIAFTQRNTLVDSSQFLFVRELYNHPLQADMVVLSACETGIGKIYQGEGVISLARAFTYAGAKSIITTLWKVNDRTTTQLMINFYQHLSSKKTKDQALWLAKRTMIEEGIHAHPYYWAGFIPIGNMTPITNRHFPFWYWGGAVLILSLFLFFFKKIFIKG